MTVERTREALSGDAAEESLNALIERRAQEAEEANRAEAAWAESVLRFDARARAERRREWIDYHNDLARLHAQLAAEHEQKVLQLIDEGGG